MLIKHWRTLRRTYLPADRTPHPDGPPVTIANIIALTLIIAILLGIVPALLPGAAHDPILRVEPAEPDRQWQIATGNGCIVYMPHGKTRCAAGNLDGSTISKTGY